MDLETIKTPVNFAYDFLSIVGCASSAKQIKDFLREKAPLLYPEWKFWDNIDKFFNSGILSDDDKRKLIGKMSIEKEKQEVGRKIIDLIGKVDTDKKLVYIINATKAWVDDVIDRPQYFRICHVISASLDEDLQFLSEHIDDTGDIPYSIEIFPIINLSQSSSNVIKVVLAFSMIVPSRIFVHYS